MKNPPSSASFQFSSEEDLIQNVSCTLKSMRLLAIEHASTYGNTQNIHDALKTRLESETDEECRILLKFAIEGVKSRIERSGKQKIKLEPENFFEEFRKSDATIKLQLIESFSEEGINKIIDSVPKLLKDEENPLVAATIIKRFAKFLSPDQFSMLTELHYSRFITVKLAAMEALVLYKPELLIQHLPSFLVSDDPRTRILAVRGLARINLEEATLYLESMLLDPNTAIKQVALQNCLLLPFDLVKKPLINFCSAESDLSFLARAGLVFKINPDPEVPFRLFEIVESSKGPKIGAMKKVLEGACNVIKAARVLKCDYQEYLSQLQLWVNKRISRRKVHTYISKLAVSETSDPNLTANIQNDLQNPIIKGAFEDALTWHIPDHVKDKVKELLSLPKPGAELPELPQKESFHELS
ncbi:HEAT repeat domain-containing protein, partial [bacterium]|nr:HEAT repeat domain-containing protein [bacterium]